MKDPASAYRRLVEKAEAAAEALEASPDDSELAATVERLTREIELARSRVTAFRGLGPLRVAARENPERNLFDYLDALGRAGLWGLVLRALDREIARVELEIRRSKPARAARKVSTPARAKDLRRRLDRLVALHSAALETARRPS